MKHPLHIEIRVTHGYATGWSHLDLWLPVCTGQMTEPRPVMKDREHMVTDGQLLVTLAPTELAKAFASFRQYRRALKEVETERQRHEPTFQQYLEGAIGDDFLRGCRCEHDCCGHWQQYASATRVKPREFVVNIHRYANV